MENNENKNKRSKWLPVILFTFVFVIAAGSFYAYVKWQESQRMTQTKKVADHFITAFSKQEFEQFSDLLDENSLKKEGFTKEEVVQKYQTIFSAIQAEEIKQEKSNLSLEEGDTYQFTYTLSMTTALGALKNLSYQTTIKKVEDQYKITWAPKLIFPKMSGKDKVSITIDSAKRGELIDRNGAGLAINQVFDEVGLVPEKLGEGAERTKNIQEFSQQFDVTEKEIEQFLAQSWVKDDSFVPIKVSFEPIESLPTGATTGSKEVRYYPLGEAAAQLIGYVGTITAEDIEKNPELSSSGVIGKTGLEQAYDSELRGQDGGSLLITDENGQVKEELQQVDRKDGGKIQLTIDKNVQEKAFSIFDRRPGSVVVTNPKTGDLLVAVSSPSFDPNKMANGISQKAYDVYAKNELLPFTARFATGYAPGSTFKTITGAIGLDVGTINPNEEIKIDGLKWQKDASWGGYFATRVRDVSSVNLKSALINSDNIYFAQQTLKMGEETFRKGLDKFIFGEKLDLPIPMNPAQISNERTFNSEILLADTGYGQGQLLISPIQQATMYSVFQNQGKLVYPNIKAREETKTKDNVISSNAADTIVGDLLGSVEDEIGYAHSLYKPDFSLAAKTGTAEIKDKQDTTGTENSFLLAMDRSNNQFLALIMIEDSLKNGTAVDLSVPLIQELEKMK